MRLNGSSKGETRSSALWGKPSKGETRSSALWGKGGRGVALVLLVAVVLGAPMAAGAGRSSNTHDTRHSGVSLAWPARAGAGKPERDLQRHRPGLDRRDLVRGRCRRVRRAQVAIPAGASASASASAPSAASRRSSPAARSCGWPSGRDVRAITSDAPVSAVRLHEHAALAVRRRLPRRLEHPGGGERACDRRRRLRHPGRPVRLRHAHRRPGEPDLDPAELGR